MVGGMRQNRAGSVLSGGGGITYTEQGACSARRPHELLVLPFTEPSSFRARRSVPLILTPLGLGLVASQRWQGLFFRHHRCSKTDHLSFRVPVVILLRRQPVPEAGGPPAVPEERAGERGGGGHPQPLRAIADKHQKRAGGEAGRSEILPATNPRG